MIITDELYDLLYTSTDCTPLFAPYIHRKFRRNEYEERIPCPGCNPTASGTLEGDLGCPYCKGLGWLWDDHIITGWLYGFEARKATNSMLSPTASGRELDKDFKIVTLGDSFIHPGDLVFDVKLDKNKRIAAPLILQERFLCIFSDRYTSNGSNSEYNVAGLKR